MEKETVNYYEKVKRHRQLKTMHEYDEVVRAFLIDRLVNTLEYKVENLETEKEYTIKRGDEDITESIDVIVKDVKGNPFFFIEAKAIYKD